jgi:uncharacterized integral membrane protein
MKPQEAAVIILLAMIAGAVIGISLSVARIETSLTTGCAMGGK